MNTIAYKPPFSGFSSHQNPLSEFRSAGYIREQSIKAQESLDAGLVIETRDGDQVTISTSSYKQMDTFMYDSRGYVQNENGSAAFGASHREITLASGHSFSFSVDGNLSEDELNDIENILKNIDGVISKMTRGDMSGAMDKALKMGAYDTVSAYSADISYQRSYEMSSVEAATATRSFPAQTESQPQPAAAPLGAEHPDNEAQPQSVLAGNSFFSDVDSLFNTIMEQLEKHSDRHVALAQKPVNSLFNHHLEQLDNDAPEKLVETLQSVMAEVDAYIENNIRPLFDQLLIEVEDSANESEE